ncbi:2-dehydropantoate 2-reductase [Actinomadura sp. HBU206391]|uniref:2-dehydropantoate 2-reductase n=1 Tax=Actinomadura sp. HBU206391 TaxID=2731692 RepID=UPI00164FF9C0|nr:2-dehydropantoate 2-reductase [Actinomadura sp. HBU206391]MBC6460932.1 2-dehydropantoate 2-reductase [Actinomadura sp. HBU206391]
MARVCVVGAGAIGGYLGANLAVAGCATSAVARNATLSALREHGWRLRTAEGLITAPVRATDEPAELGPQDVVVIAVKAPALPDVAARIAPLLGPETIVVAAMNGVPWWFFDGIGGPWDGLRPASADPGGAMAAAVETERVIGCVVHTACSVSEPGVVQHGAGRRFILGEPDGSVTERVSAFADLLGAAGLEPTVSTSIRADVWYKLWGNMTMNPVSVLTGATSDLILDDPLVNGFCQAVMAEAARIGAKIGCPIEQSPAERNAVTRGLGAMRTSMLQDAEAGKPLEIDALLTVAREIGQAVGEPTPMVDALLGLTRLNARVRGLYAW